MTKRIALSLHGTLSGVPFGTTLPEGKYVYQRVAPGLGNDTSDPTASQQIRRHVIPADPMSPAQLAQRAKMQSAMAAWAIMDPAERAEWRAAAVQHQTTGFHWFISRHLRGLV